MTETAAAASLWRNRSYMCYRASRAVSMLGSRISGIAGPLLVLSMGGGAVRAGAVGSAMLIARMAFQLPGGQLADRFDQRSLMLAMDVVRLVAVGSIPLAAVLSHVTFPQMMVVAAIEGAASAVFGSSAMVFLRVAVPPGQFARAMSQSQGAFGATALVGPLVGGALYGVDRILPFIVDTSSYVLSGVLLLAVSVRARTSADGEPGGRQQADRRVTAGLRWLWGQRRVKQIMLFCSVLNLVGAATGVAAVVVMSERGTPASVIGIVMACGGSGMVIGSLVARRVVALGPVRLYLGCGFLWGCSLAAVAASSSPWVVGVVLTFLSVMGPSTGVMFFQMLRDATPQELYGRVVSAQQLVGSSLATAGPLLAGVLVAAFGGTYLWLVLAGTCLVATVLTIRPLSRQAADEAPAAAQAVAMAQRT